MTDALLAYAIAKMKQYGIVDSGDAAKHGIGAMSDARWQDFYKTMVEQGLYRRDMDYAKAYTLHFVNQRTGSSSAPK
jgi:NitT/TauT family transport system substrate-binding protein